MDPVTKGAAALSPDHPFDGPLLDVQGLRTVFHTPDGDVHAVNGVSFTVDHGEFVGMVGETGCGKSATVRSALGIISPPGRVVAGQVKFRGVDLTQLSRRQRRGYAGTGIAFVPQNPWGSLNPILRIEKQFRNLIRGHDRTKSRRECREMALDVLHRVGIQGPERVLAGYAHELSGGMAQRVVIGLCMVLDPWLLVADEPTTGLDVTIERQILDLMAEVLDRRRRGMLLVTHDLGVVAQYCSSVVIMYAGTVVEYGPVDRVFTAPSHPYTAALLGAIPRPGHKITILRGKVPDLIDFPPACPFSDRCDHVFDRCVEERPEIEMRPVSGVRVACHLPAGAIEDVTSQS